MQIAALRERSEADAIARRLAGKGYAAYVVVPAVGATPVYKVQVGRFKNRQDAEKTAARLKKEEQFSPGSRGSTRSARVDVLPPVPSLALALISGALLALSFPRFGTPAFAWIALVPLCRRAGRAAAPRVGGLLARASPPASSTSPARCTGSAA